MRINVSRFYPSGSALPGEGPDLVVVGAASRDLVPTTEDGRGWRLGGSVCYCSLAAARLGLRVGALIGLDAEAMEASELDLLREAGVRIERVPLASGPVFENIEIEGHRRQRWTSKSDPIPTEALPVAWRWPLGWLFGPVAGEVGQEWAPVPALGSRVTLGWQGLLRAFSDNGWVVKVDPAPSPLLSRADLVCASLDDLPGGALVTQLGMPGPLTTLVVTAGERGGVAWRSGDNGRPYRAVPADVVDPTGAGDVFMAALMVVWLHTRQCASADALRFAAAAASCTVERPGLLGVPSADAVAARLAADSIR